MGGQPSQLRTVYQSLQLSREANVLRGRRVGKGNLSVSHSWERAVAFQ